MLDKNLTFGGVFLLGIYQTKLSTDIVILTTERVEHIKNRHSNKIIIIYK